MWDHKTKGLHQERRRDSAPVTASRVGSLQCITTNLTKHITCHNPQTVQESKICKDEPMYRTSTLCYGLLDNTNWIGTGTEQVPPRASRLVRICPARYQAGAEPTADGAENLSPQLPPTPQRTYLEVTVQTGRRCHDQAGSEGSIVTITRWCFARRTCT